MERKSDNTVLANELAGATILVVDDEAPNVKLMEKMLASADYRNVISTQDSRTVVALCQQHPVDLLLLDINMPHLNGFEVMSALQAAFGADMPTILVLSAQAAQEYRNKALETGARDYVSKPFDRVELLMRVRNLLGVQFYQKRLLHENEILESRVQARTRELHETRLQVVQRLGRAAEYRDNETGLHIIRMSKSAALLGSELGLRSYQIDLLLNASPMHDIGKIGIPDSILLKPGKLDAAEWEHMKRHTTIGAEILSNGDSDLLNMAREIAISHHEKWDGSGYPNGLAGEAIPLTGRICAVADVFDALTSTRPYKRGWSLEDAANFITTNSGTHFDPQVVDAFQRRLSEIYDIQHQYAEPE